MWFGRVHTTRRRPQELSGGWAKIAQAHTPDVVRQSSASQRPIFWRFRVPAMESHLDGTKARSQSGCITGMLPTRACWVQFKVWQGTSKQGQGGCCCRFCPRSIDVTETSRTFLVSSHSRRKLFLQVPHCIRSGTGRTWNISAKTKLKKVRWLMKVWKSRSTHPRVVRSVAVTMATGKHDSNKGKNTLTPRQRKQTTG